jgi:hypothetical protein
MMTTAPELPPGSDVDRPERPGKRRQGWIGWSLLLGLVLAGPCGWLLAFLAALPFLLGLFFALMLGLIVGAAMFRVGPGHPVPSRATVIAVGSIVAFVLMSTSLAVEYRALAGSLENGVRKRFPEAFTPARRARLAQEVRAHVARDLETRYPPGGFLGYLRWAAADGTITCPKFTSPTIATDRKLEYQLPQRKRLWIIRVVLSWAMVEWTVVAVLMGLRSPRSVSAETPAGTAPGGAA